MTPRPTATNLMDNLENEENIEVVDTPPPVQVAKKRKNNYSYEEKLLEIEAKKLQFLETEEDDNLLFFRSLLPHLKKLPTMQQLRARARMQEVLMDELAQRDTSVRISAFQHELNTSSTSFNFGNEFE